MHYKPAVAALALALAGCSVFPPDVPEPAPAPGQYAHAAAAEAPAVAGAWWKSFASPELDRLVEHAFAHGFTLAEARERLARAQAAAGVSEASLWPALSADGSAANKRSRAQKDKGGEASLSTARSYGLGMSASYELDLWGRVAATVESSRRSLEAAELDLAAARVSVAGSVAAAWVSLLAARDERAVIVRQIATNEELYSIRKAEYENGRATGLQLIAQLETLESVRARLPAIEQTIARYENALAILMGEAPGAAAMAALMPRGGLGPVPGAFAAGLPAAVIAARPDVQSLWRAALAAAWDVSALKAERLPKIRLSASLAFSAAEPGLVFDNWVRSLGAALGLDLFDGGAREARIDRARSLARSALISYAQGVASALEEVDNALVREARQREILEQTDRRIALARLALEQARLAWQQGSENFSTYMNKLESLQALERSAVTQKGEVMLARIALMRALAGDAADEQATQGSQP